MARPRGYHHGDLRAALVQTAVDVIAERGVHAFSVAEASRRIGVAVSAPYAHFADRDEVLAAVAVEACRRFHAALLEDLAAVDEPPARLAAIAAAYVRFAGSQRPLFDVLFSAGLDKRRHPGLEAAERPIDELFQACVHAVAGDGATARALAVAIEACAHGHAMLLLDGSLGDAGEAAGRAARATLALVEGRRALAG